MNILVTGANGFIGSSIISKLSNKYNFFKGTRNTIDLYSLESIEKYITSNRIEGVIHCAIEGGSRLKIDEPISFYNNILMYKNLSTFNYKFFINFASGAEFDRRFDINNKNENEINQSSPIDYYGLSKNIIASLSIQKSNYFNLRVFGCFYHNELETRFIKGNILKYIQNKHMIIHQDKYMDFIYLEDLCNVVDYCISDSPKYNDINMSYLVKYKLSDIANCINDLTSKKVPIIIENSNMGLNYTGNGKKLNELNVKIKNLVPGIQECYDRICYEYKNSITSNAVGN